LPNNERLLWALDPFEGLGPLRFGMTSGEVSAVLEGCVPGLESGTTFRIYPRKSASSSTTTRLTGCGQSRSMHYGAHRCRWTGCP